MQFGVFVFVEVLIMEKIIKVWTDPVYHVLGICCILTTFGVVMLLAELGLGRYSTLAILPKILLDIVSVVYFMRWWQKRRRFAEKGSRNSERVVVKK